MVGRRARLARLADNPTSWADPSHRRGAHYPERRGHRSPARHRGAGRPGRGHRGTSGPGASPRDAATGAARRVGTWRHLRCPDGRGDTHSHHLPGSMGLRGEETRVRAGAWDRLRPSASAGGARGRSSTDRLHALRSGCGCLPDSCGSPGTGPGRAPAVAMGPPDRPHGDSGSSHSRPTPGRQRGRLQLSWVQPAAGQPALRDRELDGRVDRGRYPAACGGSDRGVASRAGCLVAPPGGAGLRHRGAPTRREHRRAAHSHLRPRLGGRAGGTLAPGSLGDLPPRPPPCGGYRHRRGPHERAHPSPPSLRGLQSSAPRSTMSSPIPTPRPTSATP